MPTAVTAVTADIYVTGASRMPRALITI